MINDKCCHVTPHWNKSVALFWCSWFFFYTSTVIWMCWLRKNQILEIITVVFDSNIIINYRLQQLRMTMMMMMWICLVKRQKKRRKQLRSVQQPSKHLGRRKNVTHLHLCHCLLCGIWENNQLIVKCQSALDMQWHHILSSEKRKK